MHCLVPRPPGVLRVFQRQFLSPLIYVLGQAARARVFARVEPQQMLDIVQVLQRNGHFVAVSGDAANDVPALRAAQVGWRWSRAGPMWRGRRWSLF